MKSNTFKVLAVAGLILAVGLIAATSTFFSKPVFEEEALVETTEAVEETVVEQSQVDYETTYIEYIQNNKEYFSRGMILCDLNDDKIPEMFSLAYDEEGDLVQFHQYKDGVLISPTDATPETYINIDNLIQKETFYENPDYFFGLYENKGTGQKALINSIADGSENDRLDVITYDGNNLNLQDKGVKEMVGYMWPVAENRDSLMNVYKLSEEEICTSFVLRGEFSEMAAGAFEELNESFKASEKTVTYDEAVDEEFYCYVRNVNFTNNEIELIPAVEITLEEYTNAMNSDRLIMINGEQCSIQYDEHLADYYGISTIFQMPWFEYHFYIPTEQFPVSIVNGYRDKNPIKVKFNDDVKVKVGAHSIHQEGSAEEYDVMLTMDEFFDNYAQNKRYNCYKAKVENNELVYLDLLYNE